MRFSFNPFTGALDWIASVCADISDLATNYAKLDSSNQPFAGTVEGTELIGSTSVTTPVVQEPVGTTKISLISNTSSFRYFRLNVTASNTTYFYLGQIQIYDGVNLITPSNMTADNLPVPYVVSANYSYEVDVNWRKYFAFDSYIGSSPLEHMGWNSNLHAAAWIVIDLGSAQFATSYKLYSTSHNKCPNSWTLEGSNTGAFAGEQVILDTRSGVANWGADAAVTYTIASTSVEALSFITLSTERMRIDAAGGVDWSAGNVIYVPLAGSIQTYVTAAAAGDTLILAAGTYTLTAAITVAKALKIQGQGVGKTIVNYASTTAMDYVFNVTADNVTISDMTIVGTTTGTTNFYGVRFNGAAGTVFSNCRVINCVINVSGAGTIVGTAHYDAGGVIQDTIVTATATGLNKPALGVYLTNAATAEAATNLYCFNVQATATGTGSGTLALGFYSADSSASQDSNLYLYGCFGYGTGLSALEAGAYADGNDAYIYAENSVFQGDDADVAQANSAVVQLRNCTLVNGTTSGTITYSGTTVSGALQTFGGFGCNTKTPQTAYASGGAITPGAGAFGADSAINFAAMVTLVQNIRAALVANGIMS